jgi:uncharacterized membrane protein
MTLETTKILGGIGAVLMLVSPIGTQTGLVGLAGIILVMIAVYRLSYHYNEPAIFNNALYGAIIAIVGVTIFAAVMAITLVDLMGTLGIDINWNNWMSWTMYQNIHWEQITDWNTYWPYISIIIADFAILFVSVTIAGTFLRKTFHILGEKTGIHAFNTAATLIFIGAILTIIVVGLLLIWIALLFLAIAFFSIRTT